MIGVLLIDDRVSFRQSLAFALDRQPEISVVAQASALAEAHRMQMSATVAIISLDIPDAHDVELVREVRASYPDGLALVLGGDPHVLSLVLSTSADHERIAGAIASSALSIVSKSVGIEAIFEAVRHAGAGEQLSWTQTIGTLLETAAERHARDREGLAQLTKREHEVLQALGEGLSDREIATRIGVGHETVRSHVVRILRKLDVDSRLQAVIAAVRTGVVTIR